MLVVKIHSRKCYKRYLARIREALWKKGFSDLVDFVLRRIKERRPIIVLEAQDPGFHPQTIAWWRGRLPSAQKLIGFVWVGDWTH